MTRPDRFRRAARQLGKSLRRRQPRLASLAATRVRLALWTEAEERRVDRWLAEQDRRR